MSDQQYTALMIYLLSLGTLLAAVQMDIKLIFFSVFLAFCAFLIAVPADNPTLIAVGNTLGISEPQAKPVLVSSAVAVAGFVASLFVVFIMRGALIAKRASKKRKKAA
jgi:ABC-type antimicrobial peptide transport system permease subunit